MCIPDAHKTEACLWQLEYREAWKDWANGIRTLRNALSGWMQYKDKDRFPQINLATKRSEGSCFLYVKQRQGQRCILKEMSLYFVNGTSSKSKSSQPAFFINLKVYIMRFTLGWSWTSNYDAYDTGSISRFRRQAPQRIAIHPLERKHSKHPTTPFICPALTTYILELLDFVIYIQY